MAGISVVSVILLLSAVITTVDLALFTDVGIGSWLLLTPHHHRFEPTHRSRNQ